MTDIEQLTRNMNANQEAQTNQKSTGVAYALWFFFWWAGGHNFYLSRPAFGLVQLLLTLTVAGIFVTAVWTIIDAFVIPQWTRDYNHGQLKNARAQWGVK